MRKSVYTVSTSTVWGAALLLVGSTCGPGTASTSTPARASAKGPPAFVQLSSMGDHTCGLHRTGAIWCWGRNRHGQLGDGSTADQNSPVKAKAKGDSVKVGWHVTCALTRQGKLWCWGSNEKHQLGVRQSDASSRAPVEIKRFVNLTDLTDNRIEALPAMASMAPGGKHVCALTRARTVLCWGWHKVVGGAFQVMARCDREDQPCPVTQVRGAQWVASGLWSSCALDGLDQVWCWGRADKVPTKVSGLSRIAAVASSMSTHCALHKSGKVTCWPIAKDQKLTPVEGLSSVKHLAAGYRHHCALKRDGTVWCWGRNTTGQLGDGTVTDRTAPVQVQGLPRASEVAPGQKHTCALLHDGSVWCWGDNNYGQLGNGTHDNSVTPQRVKFPARPRAPRPARRSSSPTVGRRK